MKKLTLIKTIILMAGILISLNLKSQTSNLANIDEFITEQMEIFHVPGLSAVIIKGDSVIWNHNYGYMNLEDSIPVNDNTVFNVFSIGKTLSSSCVMQLWDRDYLELDQNVNDFLPFQIDSLYNDPDSITARMVMNHSSGIYDWNFYPFVTEGDPTISLSYFLENYLVPGGEYWNNSNFYNIQQGSAFNYDNYGMALTGYLIEPLTGIPFNEFAKDSLLIPLEMDESGWFLYEINLEQLATGYEYSGGNFVAKLHRGHPAYPGISFKTSALELANFASMMLNNGLFKNNVILSNMAVDSMETIQNPDWSFSFGTTGMGIFQRDDYGNRIVWGHNGGSAGGYAAQMYYCKDENSAIVFTTNSEQYIDPLVIQLFDYAGLYVQTNFATDITDTGFAANWTEASIAAGYLIDIALDDGFSTLVDGYENLDVGNSFSFEVSGLNSNTAYFYRIRAYNDYDTGTYSNTVSVTTLLGTDIINPQSKFCKVWTSKKTIHIELSGNDQNSGNLTYYTLSGQQLGNIRLKAGLNSIDLNIKRQPILLNVNSGGKILRKKIMVW